MHQVADHTFVKHGGKYYDAESPKGEKDWRSLSNLKDDKTLTDDDIDQISTKDIKRAIGPKGDVEDIARYS